MKKITVTTIFMAVLLSACNQEPQSTAITPSQTDQQSVPVNDIGTQDISEVTVKDIPVEPETIPADEYVQSSDEPPVELHLSERFNEHVAKMGNGNYLQLDLSAVSDEVIIHNVTVNRGNTCAPYMWYSRWPGHGTLKFGQTVSAHIQCNFHSVKEIVIDTDLGSYTFNF